MSVIISQKRIRVLAIIMAFLMLAVIMISSAYLALHSDHDCAEEDCPICECMRICESLIRSAGCDIVFNTAAFVLPVIFFIYVLSVIRSFAWDTPVTMKVRLND